MQRPHFPDQPFTTAEARQLGSSAERLSSAVREGVLRRLFTGVYVRTDVVDSMALRAQAARLVMNRDSVLCNRTAAWLHGVDVFRYGELQIVPELESFVLRGRRPTERHDCHGRTRDLRPEDWQVVDGVRVTTPVRTAVDLACELSRRDALSALDALSRHCGVTVFEMNALLSRFRRRRGVIQARELVQLTDPRAESSGETWTRLEIHDRGLPEPVPQHWVNVDGVPTYRLDLAYPKAKVAVEYDGEAFHSEPADRARDEERREWLRRHGWYVIVVTKASFTEEAARAWTDELRTVLSERGVQLSR